MNSALVLFSGGQDSTVCLAWALSRFELVETIGFDYGQRHSVELDCRMKVRLSMRQSRLGSDHLLSLPELGRLSDTALTKDVEITAKAGELPNTFVPGRNLIFLTYAAAVAYREGHRHIVGGMCETDYAGYPDCRAETIEALSSAINFGMEADFKIHTPLMSLSKAETWKLAHDLGGSFLVDLIVNETHTCYSGDRSRLHDWGYGCGECPACELRAKGYAEFRR